MDQQWFYTRDGQARFGPVSGSQLHALAQSGRVLPTDAVWTQGMAQWQPATAVTGLFAVRFFAPEVGLPPQGRAASSHAPLAIGHGCRLWQRMA